jgi:VanZ family protein
MNDSRAARAKKLRQLASKARTLAVVYVAILFAGTHFPSSAVDGFSWEDKLIHLSGYAVLTFFVLVGWDLTIGMLKAKHYFAVWLAGTIYAAADEITQELVGRTCDIDDWAADMFGIVLGMVLFGLMRGTVYRVFLGREPQGA